MNPTASSPDCRERGVPRGTAAMSSKRSKVHPKYKTKYRVRNWPAYDRSVVARGDLTVWVACGGVASLVHLRQLETLRTYPDDSFRAKATLEHM